MRVTLVLSPDIHSRALPINNEGAGRSPGPCNVNLSTRPVRAKPSGEVFSLPPSTFGFYPAHFPRDSSAKGHQINQALRFCFRDGGVHVFIQ
ncbi:MAG: hypothetical protein ACTSUE_15015 [Promethearchaeota archaeon]